MNDLDKALMSARQNIRELNDVTSADIEITKDKITELSKEIQKQLHKLTIFMDVLDVGRCNSFKRLENSITEILTTYNYRSNQSDKKFDNKR